MWSRFQRLRRGTKIAVVVGLVFVAGLAAVGGLLGALFWAERHPESAVAMLGLPTGDRPYIIAHRGASDEAPENTLAAFARAREAGADGVECDFVFTRDNVPVIIHDDNLGEHRMKRPGPWIKDLNLAEAKELDIGSWFAPEFSSERIPTVREGLDFLHPWARRVYLHDKETNDYAGPNRSRINAVAEAIRESGMIDHAVVMVAGDNYELWHELAPDVHALQCWMEDNNQPHILTLEHHGSKPTTYLGMHVAYLHHFDWIGRDLLSLGLPNAADMFGHWPAPSDLARYHAQSCEFVVFTVNDPFHMRLYARKGFDAIGTDKPRLMRASLERSTAVNPSH